MINLLPPLVRKDMSYARKNSVLLRWTTVFLFAILGIGLIVGSGLIYLSETTKSYERRTAAGHESLKEQKIDETQKKVDDISNNVKLATQVLSREILFSKLLTKLGFALPSNTSLRQLQIDNLKGGITLSAGATDFNAASQIQINLADPKNQIFQKADIDNIVCDQQTTDSRYPCTVQLRALFMKDNPFLYITPTPSIGVNQ